MPARPDTAGGPAYHRIDAALHALPEYLAYRHGELSRADYCASVAGVPPETFGLDVDQLNLSTRFPLDGRLFVREALNTLRERGVIPVTTYPEDAFDELWKSVDAGFDHAGRTTYIFPEEARLLFALAYIVAPATTVFSGSYYGYWAVWALPGIIDTGGRAALVDIDGDASAVARRNLAALGLAGPVEFVVDDAVAYGRQVGPVDLCVLDAEGPKHHDDEDLRDKAIYYPITAATTPALRPDGLLVAHNVLLENLTENAYFASRIRHNLQQFTKWQAHLDEHYDVQCVLPTSEGTGVYRRRAARSGAAPSSS